jgi:hypothetical protein
MEKPTGSGGEEGDSPPSKPETASKKLSPEKEEKIKEPSKPTEIVKKKETPMKREPESSPTKIKREDSGDGAETSSGSRVKSDSSSSSHAEDVQRALTEYMTMAQVK